MKKFHKGFTLIEVLVALAILGIALTAIIKATSQNIRDTQYLQDKQIATWVATETLNEARARLIELSDHYQREKKYLNQSWNVSAYSVKTANPHIMEVHVDVSKPQNNAKLISLTSYIYAPKT